MTEHRQKTIGILERLATQAAARELPKPPALLDAHRQKLANNTYQVLVVGEAKRGKSTFVNALIGRELLPTDVDVATCQVFRVRRAEQPAFRLRFEDESAQDITVEELTRYGSQRVADTEELPRPDHVIRWIEADVPVAFLPLGMSILDTPGLGSLYAAHAQITQRFVPQADAVIFVLDSERPIIEPEVQFLDSLLGVTPHVLFIQTKIDRYREDAWRAVQARNEAVLRERFADRLAEAHVWPISSTNLLKAGETGDQDYLEVSLHRELAAALNSFLFRAAGWARAADALALAEQYHGTGRQVLAGRLTALSEESKQKRAELQQTAHHRRQQFQAEWGETGQSRRKLLEEVQRISDLGRQAMRQTLVPGGTIELAQRQRIAAVASIDAANELGQSLASDTVAAATAAWQNISGDATRSCTALLAPFLAAADAAQFVAQDGTQSIAVGQSLSFSDDWWMRLKTVRMEQFTAVWLGGLVTTLFPPALPFAVAGVLLTMISGWRSGGKVQVDRAKQQLSQHMAEVLQKVRSHFFDVDYSAKRGSLVDEYFGALAAAMKEQIQTLTEQKLREAQDEIERLSRTAELDDQQRRARVQDAQQQLAEWDGLGRSIQQAIMELKALDPSRAPVAAAA